MPQRVRGQPRIADRLLKQRAECVPQLVGVEGWNVEAPRELVADVPRPVIGQSVVASPFLPRSERLRLEADEEGEGGVVASGEVVVNGFARLLGHDEDSLTITFAAHSDAVRGPVTAVESRPRFAPAAPR
jgi:hypothetical protein